MPQMRGLNLIQSALESDAASQSLKYGTEEPSCRSARFCVSLPQTPQHQKFCYGRGLTEKQTGFGTCRVADRDADREAGREAEACRNFKQDLEDRHPALEMPLAIPHGPKPSSLDRLRLNKTTLHTIFREIDSKATGFVTRRALIVALQRKLQLTAAGTAEREATNWLMDVMDEVDSDKSGSLSWHSFLVFFRRAGILLEYERDASHLDQLNQELDARQHELKTSAMAEACPSDLASDIRTMVGKADEARFKKNRRAGSPA